MVLFALTSPSSSSKLKQHSHRSFSESLMEDSIEDAEAIIHQWISPDSFSSSSSFCCTFSLFSNKNREEAKQFIRAVTTLHSAMVKLISANPASTKLIRAESLLKTSMNHLSKEFYRILKSNRRYLDPESVSARSRNSSRNISKEDDDAEAMADLKMIADCMTSSGYGKECFRIYKKIRKSIIVEALEQLGFESLTLSQVQKLEWESTEKKTRVWLRAARKAVTTLFRGERILSDHVFSSSAALRESSFAEITLQSALALFSFPGNVARSRKTPEKIFLTLDVYQSIVELMPRIEEVFSYDSTSSVKSQIAGTLANLEEAVVSMIDEFESSISKESSKSMISNGGIHQLTRYVMNYIVFLADYSEVLVNIIPETSSFASPEEDESTSSSSLSSPLAKRISWLILFLLCKIDAKSRLYSDVALSYLFLINNLHYVVVKVRTSNLKEVLSEGWLEKHEGKLKKHVAKFEEIVWGELMTSLATAEEEEEEEEEEEAEEFVRRFSDRFEEAYKRQTGWVVPDSKLRDEIKVSAAMMLIPLILCVAENGHTFEFNCSETTPVESVMRFVESVSGIAFSDQLLLSLDMKLEPQKLLSAYGLPSSGREVFVFNKSMLQSSSHPPSPEDVDLQEVDDALPPAPVHELHPLDDALDPALKALPLYERQFRYHFHKGRAFYNCTVVRLESCERLTREQKVQQRAVEVATRNLEQYYRVIFQNFLEFMKRYKHQHRLHSDLLMNFGRDVEKLRSVKVHPCLQTDSRRCLLDFVKEDNLKKAAESCGISHKQFENKIAQFQQMFVEVKRKVEELFACRDSLTTKSLEAAVKDHERFINEQKSIMQSLSKDVDTVKKLVDDCMSSQSSSSLRPHDAVSALGPMYEVHDKNHLPKMQACYNSISELLDFCKSKKNEMNIFVHSCMQKITYVTYVIKDAKLQFPVFREAMVRQDELFADLKLVRGVGAAYRACLAEAVRRRSSMKLYMGMAGQLAEKLAMKRETEVRRREEFLKTHGPFLPRDVLSSMGLYDTPTQCDVNVSPYDTSLINIEMADVDRYAPEYLVGLHSKVASSRSSLGMSSDSSLSAEAEEISLDKDSFEDILEASELVEIAGTSKMEVENAKLKAELASAISRICSLGPQVEYDVLEDGSEVENLLKNASEKTAEALQAKDEYEKHLLSMLKEKQRHCDSYEKRIRELEQRLNDEYLQGKRYVNSKDVSGLNLMEEKGNKAHVSGSEPMDEVSCVSNLSSKQPCKAREGMDENMVDSSQVLSHHPLDSSMLESQQNNEKGGKDNVFLSDSSTAESPTKSLGNNVVTNIGLDTKHSDDFILELKSELMEKSDKLSETESKLNGAMEEVASLSRELEMNQKILEESQMNCAHLENCLHEAREEAQTHLCAADRRASEYTALRASAVKMRGLFERFRSSVCAGGGVAGFADSLRTLAQALDNSINDNEDDGTVEFRKCIRVLADKVSYLSQNREELFEKCRNLEATSEQTIKDLKEKRELVKTLYTKHQLGKQANKEKISFGRLEVHEIAAFVLNQAGHYEAINRNCPNYYLSSESEALFTDHLPIRPTYIVGQIVHIERQAVKQAQTLSASATPEAGKRDYLGSRNLASSSMSSTSSSGATTTNPYGLSSGCEYFIVTIAMLPDTAIHQQAS